MSKSLQFYLLQERKNSLFDARNGCKSGSKKQSVLYALDYFLYQHSLWFRLNFSGIANGTGDGWLVYKSCSSNGGCFGIFNGFGRLLWASLSDYIGRPLTFSILLLVNLFFSLSLWLFTDSVLFVVAMSILMTCYGAGFL